jgi:hypothetical protein
VIRKLAIAAVFVMLVSVLVSGFSAQATTCRRVVITILDDPYFAHPICTDIPLPIDEALNSLLPPGDIHPGR